MATHQIAAEFTKKRMFTANIDTHKVVMDALAQDGGEDAAPSPKKLMLASLAGCTGIDVVAILAKMKVTFSDFTISINATLTETHPKIYNVVDIIYAIKVREADRAKVERAVQLSQEKYCGVSAMFKAFAAVNYTIQYLS